MRTFGGHGLPHISGAFGVIYLLLALQLFLIVEMRRRLRGFNSAEAISWFLWISQLVYINGEFFNDGSDAGNWQSYSYIHHPERLVFYYTCAVIMFSLSTLGMRRLSTSVAELRQSMQMIIARVAVFEPALLGVTLVIIAIHWALLDWNIILSNQTYLLMASWEAMKVDKPIGTLIQSLVTATSPISAMFLAISFSRRFNIFTFGWLTAFSWQLLMAVGGSSRSGAMFMAIFIVFFGLFSRRSRPAVQAALGLCATWAYCAALAGRGYGQFGLTAIPSILSSPLQMEAGEWLQLVSSITQGAFITGDGLDYSADFNPMYKMLSFSPLPSVIDHFSSYLALYEIRLSDYVPMGAQTEVIFFGPVYTAIFWGTLFLLCRSLIKHKQRIGIFYYFGSLYLMVTFMQSGAYPVRNVYRTFLLLLIITQILASRHRSAAAKAAKAAKNVPLTSREAP